MRTLYPTPYAMNPRQAPVPSVEASPPARRGRAPALTHDQIAGAALELVDREGLEALSMRRLAAELGVAAMSLYRYFRDKDELLDAVVEASSRQAESRVELAGPWQQQVRTLMRALHRNLTRHPSLVQIRLARPMLTPAALRLTEGAMRVLTGAGFPSATAARAYRTLFLYTFACSAFDAGRESGQLVRLAASALTALPADEYTAIAGAVPELAATMDAEAQFEHGLDVIIAGLERQLPEEQR
jgi:AcrR family transcriptional regulator